jgi:ubiquinone/menaquinone biosynthesis C-methylase UbiE
VNEELAPRAALLKMIDGYRASQLIYVAAELGLADLLKRGPMHYADLAAACAAQPRRLYRLLRAMTSLGIFTRLPGDRFELNPLTELLQKDTPGSVRPWVIFAGRQHIPAWGQLLHSVKTGETGFELVFGMNAWEYREQYPEARRLFQDATSSRNLPAAQAIADAYDFSQFECVVDVGGGKGIVTAAILQANPSVRAVVMDLEVALRGSKEYLESIGLTDRCEFVVGDFLDSVNARGDCLLLSRVIHDWDDEQAVQILTNCRRAMQSGHKLLIVERVLAPDSSDPEGALTDLSMMVVNGGRERTLAEFQSLLSASGFAFTNLVPTKSLVQVVEGIPVIAARA